MSRRLVGLSLMPATITVTVAVFAAFAGVRLAADAVHRDRQRGVRFGGDRAERHRTGREALDDFLGRLDLVENRFVGMKSRGCYETPGGTILYAAHRAMESITLDREAAHLKDSLMPRYAELVYNGFWFAPEREMLQALIDKSQEMVTGVVRLKLYKGGVHVIGRESPHSLYDQDLVTFEEGAVAYDHRDAAGFIKLNALRMRIAAMARARRGQ